jgi:hypothetical protein
MFVYSADENKTVFISAECVAMPQSNSSRLRDYIEQHLQEFLLTAHPMHQEYAQLARGLPLHGGWDAEWFIRPNGDVVIVDYDTQRVIPESDSQRRWFMIKMGVLRYPGLQALLPSRPVEADDCVICQGSGQIVIRDHQQQQRPSACRNCHGLGWIEPLHAGDNVH